MATKPSSIIEWNTGGSNNAEPSAGKKITGWVNAEAPPSTWLNWFMKLAGEWTAYLNELVTTVNTWSAAQTFNGAAGDTNAALKMSSVPTDYKLIWEGATTASGKTRLYHAAGAGLVSTTNAAWNGTNWTPDVTGIASMHTLSDGYHRVRFNASVTAATPFADGAWTNAALLTTAGELNLAGGINTTATDSVSNLLTKVNIPKVWAILTLTPGNGAGNFSVSLTDGFNITSVTRQSASVIRVTFGGDFSSANYCIGGTWQRPAVAPFGGTLWKDDAGSTAGILDLGVINTATGNAIDFDALASGTTRIHLQVFGRQ
jgi:hypothetical protein